MVMLWRFATVQARAAVFGIGILAMLLLTDAVWREDWAIYRYDFLFVVVVAAQGFLLVTGRETWAEARVIGVFHVVGVVMEIFKTAVGSWVYPEPSLLAIGGVPLFTGFMYSAVGSYIARFWRLSDMRLELAPPEWAAALLAVATYVNFFTHHYVTDIRAGLFAGIFALYFRTMARFGEAGPRVPILAFFALASVLIYIAENIGSVTGTWLYPSQQEGWRPVPVGKLGAWFLLMTISFALVRGVRQER
jgi:uncharacterized membrane protein YoaT (DUF817 family)